MTPVRFLVYEPYPFGSESGNLRTLRHILERTDPVRFCPLVVVPFATEFTDRIQRDGTRCVVVEPPGAVNRYGGEALRDGLMQRFRTATGLVRHNLDIARLIRQESIDVIYANCIRSVLCTALASLVTGTPILWYVKGELQNPLLDGLGLIVSKKTVFFCEQNRTDRYRWLIRLLGGRTGVLKIGIDPARVDRVLAADSSALERELDVTQERLNLIVLGQLYRPKGVHLLIEALGRLRDKYDNVRLYVVGDHVIEEYRSYRDELEQLIDRHAIADRVVFTGWRTDAMEVLSCMDLLVHPSLSEGFGRAVLEAMALGKPVCASRVGGLREIIRDGDNGLSFDPGDVDQLVARLDLLLGREELRGKLGAAARATVQAEYLIDDKIREFEGLLADLAPPRGAGATVARRAPR